VFSDRLLSHIVDGSVSQCVLIKMQNSAFWLVSLLLAYRYQYIGLDRYRYRVSVTADAYLSISTNTSSPVIRLPVSTVSTVETHAYSFKPIPDQKNNACSCVFMSFFFDNVTKSSLHMHTVCTFQNIMTLFLVSVSV